MKQRMETVDKYMTPLPETVTSQATIGAAGRLMRTQGFRHLPVMENDKLCGILSERDIRLIEAIIPDTADTLTVDLAMTEKPYTVAPEAPLEDVVRVMSRQKYGAAVVVKNDDVVGILTATDALSALAWLLDKYSV